MSRKNNTDGVVRSTKQLTNIISLDELRLLVVILLKNQK